MGGLSSYRSALLAGGMLVAGLAGATFASAQEGPPVPVSFEDPAVVLPIQPGLDVSVRDNAGQRFAPIAPHLTANGERPRRLELELAAGGGSSPVDVSVAQRASLGSDDNANTSGSGSEVRIGRGLVRDERNRSESDGRSVYMFVASDNEALTWQPGARNDFGGRSASLALEDRVEVGDMSAGVTYERNGVQASLAYVEREESTQVGTQSFQQDMSFTGVTVTMRR